MIKEVIRPYLGEDGKQIASLYESIDGGFEPIWTRSVERGEVQFWHESGYGYLPESHVEIR